MSAGKLSFSREKSTRLEVGLLRVRPGDSCDEEGFDCHDDATVPPGGDVPVLEIGTAQAPIPAGVTTLIRLRYFDGMNRDTLPAIVSCGGRWEVHGAAMPRSWLKLAGTAQPGAREVTLSEVPAGWRAGDRVIVTGSLQKDYRAALKTSAGGFAGATEERVIESITGPTLTPDRPLDYKHLGEEMTSSEVANLSRNAGDADWKMTLSASGETLTASASDEAGSEELWPRKVTPQR